MIVDSHCHINDEAFAGKEQEYLNEAHKANVQMFLDVGCNVESSRLAVYHAKMFNDVYASVGIHPSDCKGLSLEVLDDIESLIDQPKIIAIGEIGLDYYWEKDKQEQEHQKDFFIRQINLANKYELPIIVHCRDALNECLTILKSHPVNKKGVIHCYGGSLELAKEFVKLGYLLGIGGVSTFKNAVKIKEVIKNIGIENLIVETDAPYLAPVPFRGQINSSKYLPYIIQNMADLLGKSPEIIEEITTNNFRKIFLNENKN